MPRAARTMIIRTKKLIRDAMESRGGEWVMENHWLAFSISIAAALFAGIAISHYNWVYPSMMPKPAELQPETMIELMDIPRWILLALFTASLPGLFFLNYSGRLR